MTYTKLTRFPLMVSVMFTARWKTNNGRWLPSFRSSKAKWMRWRFNNFPPAM